MYTNEPMLSNAFNHLSPTQRVFAFPRKAITPMLIEIMDKRGNDVIDVNHVKRSVLRQAMLQYRANTDWSAFSKEDWTKAMAELTGKKKAVTP